jgi:hypothetical protein
MPENASKGARRVAKSAKTPYSLRGSIETSRLPHAAIKPSPPLTAPPPRTGSAQAGH